MRTSLLLFVALFSTFRSIFGRIKTKYYETETISDWRTGQDTVCREASDLLSIPVEELLKFYAGQREISLSNLLKRICRSNPIYQFPIIGEPTYTLKGVMDATGTGRSWSLFFLERNCVRAWCVGVHYLYAKVDVDNAWRKESIMWDEWIPLLQVPGVYGLDIRVVLHQIANGVVQVRPGEREQLVSRKDIKMLWKRMAE